MKPAALHARLQAVRDDHAMLVRSVAIRAAYAFGDWPPLSSSRELSTARLSAPRGAGVSLDSSLDVREPSMGRPVG